MTTKLKMQDIVNLAKNRGFIYAGSEIYGGLANAWDYGPYGSLLKENIKNLWIKEFVQKRMDMVLLDAAILMNPQTWVASGHVGGFSDPLIDDKNTKERFRADKLLEDFIEKIIHAPGLSNSSQFIKNFSNVNDYLSPSHTKFYGKDGNTLLDEDFEKLKTIFEFIKDKKYNKNNEILNEEYCLLGNDGNIIFLDFPNTDDLKVINNFVIEQIKIILSLYLKEKYNVANLVPESWPLEIQTQVMRGEKVKNPNTGEPGDWSDAKQFNLMFKTSQGVTDDSSSTIYLRPETAQGIFVDFPNILRTSRKKIPFGVAQVGKAFRNEITPGNFIFRTREFEQMEIEYFVEPGKDLEAHKEWKQRCKNFLTQTLGIKEENLRLRDHEQDELSHYSNATTDIEFKYPFGWGELWGIADRTDFDLKAHMAESKQDMSYFDPTTNRKYIPYVIEPSVGLTRLLLATMLDAYTIDEENNRTYLKFNPRVAPIKVAVLPVVKKIGNLAKEIYSQLSEDFMCEYDEVGSIGKRYARMDEIGVPFCVTIDSQNYEEGNVTVRYRDSMEQEIIKISELNDFIRERIK